VEGSSINYQLKQCNSLET